MQPRQSRSKCLSLLQPVSSSYFFGFADQYHRVLSSATTTHKTRATMGDLEHFVRSYLLADAGVVAAFGDLFKLSLVSHNVQTMFSKSQAVLSRTYASYKIDDGDNDDEDSNCAVVGVIADANDITRIDVFMFDGSTIPINLNQKQLEHDAKSFALADKKVRKKLGKRLLFQTLSHGAHKSEAYASFQVEGNKNIGVASVTTNRRGVRDMDIYLVDRTLNVRIPDKSCLLAKSA